MEAKIRKNQSKLICSGAAVIAFGLWSIVRVFLMRFMDPISLEQFWDAPDNIPQEDFYFLIFVVLLVFLVIDLLLRLYIGLSAIREGKGKRKRIVYVVVAFLYGLLSAVSDPQYFIETAESEITLTGVAMTVVDLTSCIAMFEIVVSSVRLRRLQKSTDGELTEAGHAD